VSQSGYPLHDYGVPVTPPPAKKVPATVRAASVLAFIAAALIAAAIPYNLIMTMADAMGDPVMGAPPQPPTPWPVFPLLALACLLLAIGLVVAGVLARTRSRLWLYVLAAVSTPATMAWLVWSAPNYPRPAAVLYLALPLVAVLLASLRASTAFYRAKAR
jgi:hypothetical protein